MNFSLKTISILVLFVAFSGVAIFGACTMAGGQSHSAACAGTPENSGCPVVVASLEHLDCHIGAIQKLSAAIFQPFPLINFLLVVFLIAFLLIIRRKDTTRSRPLYLSRDNPGNTVSPQKTILRWLSLHEKRDPWVAYAMN